MRFLEVNEAISGKCLGRTIFTGNGQVLLYNGTIITDGFIQKLIQHGITKVYIKDHLTSDIALKDIISEELRIKTLEIIGAIFGDMEKGNISATLYELLGVLVNEMSHQVVLCDPEAINVVNIHSANDYLFNHSLHVGLISMALAKAYTLSREQIVEIGIGTILHDIGKTQLPPDILFKTGPLTQAEWRIMKEHPQCGFELLRQIKNVPEASLTIALQHHEKMDGTGYPNRLVGEEIHLYGRIAAIADVYDALTSNRCYKNAFLPHEAIELIYGGAGRHFDFGLVETLKQSIAIYPAGLVVKLNSGEEGIVVKSMSGLHQRPIVRLIKDREGQIIETPYDIDLSQCGQQSRIIVNVA